MKLKSHSANRLSVPVLLSLLHLTANAAVGLLMDEGTAPGNGSGNLATARMPAAYVSTLAVPDASGTLFTGEINGISATATYSFSGGANWRIDPEINEDLGFFEYDGVAAASTLRLVPRLDVMASTGVPSMDIVITFDQPVNNLRMYMFGLDHSQLQFTDTNTIAINNSYNNPPGVFNYDSTTRTITDQFVRTPNANGNAIEGGWVSAEIDFNNGAGTSEIRFRITDNSPLITASHDSIDYAFATIPESSSALSLLFGLSLSLMRRRR